MSESANDLKIENFLLNEYQVCNERIKHYDNISWVVGSILIVLSSSLFVIALKTNQLNRIPLISIGIFSMFTWFSIHRRYSQFAEIANERMRDIEREFKINGLTTQYEITHFTSKILLKNIEANNLSENDLIPKYKKIKEDSGTLENRISMFKKPEHDIVFHFFLIFSIIGIIVFFLP